MSYFNENIISVDNCDAEEIAEQIYKYVTQYDKYVKTCKKIINEEYVNSGDRLGKIAKKIETTIR